MNFLGYKLNKKWSETWLIILFVVSIVGVSISIGLGKMAYILLLLHAVHSDDIAECIIVKNAFLNVKLKVVIGHYHKMDTERRKCSTSCDVTTAL